MHYRSFKFVSKHKFTAKTVSLITGRDNVNNHHRHPKPWLTQLMLMALITLPHQSNAADLATSDQATQAQRAVVFNIPRQAADDSLPVFGQQADVTVIYPFEWVKDHHTNRLQGEYSVTHAVAILLDNTGLQAQFSPEGHLVITQVDESKGKNMNTNTRKTLLAGMVGLFAAGGMTTAVAQGQVGESAMAQNVLDEIIITAQKREQNLQDVSLAVSAFTGDELDNKGIDSGADLQFLVPSLTIGPSPWGPAQVTLRGVGAENVFPGGDPGVPIHIDGHYIQASSYILQDFLDVERVEVLRGPQGTLYGRNAIGGSVNIITKRPTDTFEGYASVDVGNYNKRLFQAVVSGPLSDNVRGRLVASNEKRDGFIENLSSIGAQDLANSDYTSVRGSLEIDLTDNIQVFASAYYFDDSANSTVAILAQDYPAYADFIVDPYVALGVSGNISASDPRKVTLSNPSDDVYDKAKGVSLDLDWDLGDMIFRSLSSYNESDKRIQVDLSGSDVVINEEDDTHIYETFSQEFQLISGEDSKAQWILEAFFYDENSNVLQQLELNNLFDITGPLDPIVIPVEIDASSLGVFGQVDYPITDQLSVIAGLRYNKDKKDVFSGLFIPAFGLVAEDGGPITTSDESDEWSKSTGKIGLNYQLSDDLLLYVSYSNGYKSGGYNLTQADSYAPETVEAFEAGMKSVWFESRIQTNVSAYYYDYTNKQEFTRDPIVGTTNLINSGKASVYGIEAEMSARITEGLSIDSSISYTEAEYDEFFSEDESAPELGFQDLAGNQLPRIPEWKAYLGVQYQWLLEDNGELIFRVDSSWSDKQYSTYFNRSRDELGGYNRTNMRIAWESATGEWEAELYGLNLDDDNDKSNHFHAGGLVGFAVWTQYLSPRTYGLKVTRNFN